MIGFILFFAWLGFGGDYVWAMSGNHPFPWLGIVLNRRVPDVWFGRIVRVSVLAIGLYLVYV